MTVVVVIIYYAFGTDFALLWGLLFFVMSFIPNIGFVLAVIPPFFVTCSNPASARPLPC